MLDALSGWAWRVLSSVGWVGGQLALAPGALCPLYHYIYKIAKLLLRRDGARAATLQFGEGRGEGVERLGQEMLSAWMSGKGQPLPLEAQAWYIRQ